MKKIATFMFVALTSIALVSCGGEEKKDDKKEDKKETKKGGDDEEDDKGSDMGSSDGWPQAQQDQFMKTCVEKANENPGIDGEEYCSCMLDKVMEKYPNAMDATKIYQDQEWMMQEAAKCLGM